MKKILYIISYYLILLLVFTLIANWHYFLLGFVPIINIIFDQFKFKKLQLIADASILFILSALFMFYFNNIINLDLILFILFNITNILSVLMVYLYNFSVGRKNDNK